MPKQPCSRFGIHILLLIMTTLTCGATAIAQQKEQVKSFQDVQQIFEWHFANLSGYQTGMLLTTRDVKPLFDLLARAGWEVQNRDEILNRVIPSGSFLGKTLRTAKGDQFYRKISRNSGGMDHVERLSKLPHGQKSIQRLVYELPMGADFIKAISTSAGGEYLDRSVSKTRKGKNFGKKTGRIYTEDALSTALQASFADFQGSQQEKFARKKTSDNTSDLEKRSRQPRRIVIDYSE